MYEVYQVRAMEEAGLKEMGKQRQIGESYPVASSMTQLRMPGLAWI